MYKYTYFGGEGGKELLNIISWNRTTICFVLCYGWFYLSEKKNWKLTKAYIFLVPVMVVFTFYLSKTWSISVNIYEFFYNMANSMPLGGLVHFDAKMIFVSTYVTVYSLVVWIEPKQRSWSLHSSAQRNKCPKHERYQNLFFFIWLLFYITINSSIAPRLHNKAIGLLTCGNR